MPFDFTPLPIAEVISIVPKKFTDDRGAFLELFKKSEFIAHGISKPFVQVNYSVSRHGVVRGLHYQNPPLAQGKLVTVAQGEAFDVAVDIRRGSATYGQWVSALLTAEERNMLYIPPGFAHGFCVLSSEAHLLYFCTNEYNPQAEAGIVWNDPTVNITWPVSEPLVAPRDAAFPHLEAATNQFSV